MNEDDDSYFSMIIDTEKIIKKYPPDGKIDEEFCLDLLKAAFRDNDDEKVEDAITIAAALNVFSTKFSGIFCDLLQENWHHSHEDIARTLQDLADDSTVECLFNAAQIQFAYLDYDDTYQFARKCIKALSAINNEAAIQKLRRLSENEIAEIRQYALKELKYKGLQV